MPVGAFSLSACPSARCRSYSPGSLCTCAKIKLREVQPSRVLFVAGAFYGQRFPLEAGLIIGIPYFFVSSNMTSPFLDDLVLEESTVNSPDKLSLGLR